MNLGGSVGFWEHAGFLLRVRGFHSTQGGITYARARLELPGDILSAKNIPKFCLKMLNGRKMSESICKNIFR